MRPTKPPATRHTIPPTESHQLAHQPQYRPQPLMHQQQTQQQSTARPQIPPMHTQPSQVPQGMYTQPTVQYYVPQFTQTGRLPSHVMYLPASNQGLLVPTANQPSIDIQPLSSMNTGTYQTNASVVQIKNDDEQKQRIKLKPPITTANSGMFEVFQNGSKKNTNTSTNHPPTDIPSYIQRNTPFISSSVLPQTIKKPSASLKSISMNEREMTDTVPAVIPSVTVSSTINKIPNPWISFTGDEKPSPMKLGWARTVRNVMSGDTIRLTLPANANNMVLILQITLDAIKTRRIARNPQSVEDAYGFEAREFVRKQLDGKRLFYCIWSSSGGGSTGLMERFYGDIYIYDVPGRKFTSLTHLVIVHGYAELKQNTESLSRTEETRLLLANKEAIKNKLGIYSNDDEKHHIRNLKTLWLQRDEHQQFVKKYANKEIPAIVEQVLSGSTIRIEVILKKQMNEHRSLIVNIAGVKAPRVPPRSMSPQRTPRNKRKNKKMGESLLETKNERSDDSRSPGRGKKSVPNSPNRNFNRRRIPDGPRPLSKREKLLKQFAYVSKEWAEDRLLGQNVKVLILYIDLFNNIYARISHPKGNIAESLLSHGLAEYEPWTAIVLPGADAKVLKLAEQTAQKKKMNIWKVVKPASAESQSMVGVVHQVISGDTFTLQTTSGDEPLRFTLSSVRAPRVQQQQQSDYHRPSDYYGNEAKEYLRSLLIGKQVRVVREYTREYAFPNEQNMREMRKQSFASVYLDKKNIAENLLLSGYCNIMYHGPGQKRSTDYHLLTSAYKNAVNAKRGIHIEEDEQKALLIRSKQNRARDYSLDGTKITPIEFIKLKNYLKGHDVKAQVEYVFNGNRIKLFIPEFNCFLPIMLAGVRCGRTELSQSRNQFISNEAGKILRRMIMQRDVMLKVTDTIGMKMSKKMKERLLKQRRMKQKKQQQQKRQLNEELKVEQEEKKQQKEVKVVNKSGKGKQNKRGKPGNSGGGTKGEKVKKQQTSGKSKVVDKNKNESKSNKKVSKKSSGGKKVQQETESKKNNNQKKRSVQKSPERTPQKYLQKSPQRSLQKSPQKNTGGGGGQFIMENFLGHIFFDNQNVAVALLEAGWAQIMWPRNRRRRGIPDRNRSQREQAKPSKKWQDIQRRAQDEKLGMWKWKTPTYDVFNEAEVTTEVRDDPGLTGHSLEVIVSYIESASLFYVNRADGPWMSNMEADMSTLANLNLESAPRKVLGKYFATKYDGLFARAKVKNADTRNMRDGDKFFVHFIDYGNRATIHRSKLLMLPEQLHPHSIPELAHRCELAGIRSPAKDMDAYQIAGEYFSSLVCPEKEAVLQMKIFYDDYLNNRWLVELYVDGVSVNLELAKHGHVRMSKEQNLPFGFTHSEDEAVQLYLTTIKELINNALNEHSGMWEYGYQASDESEDYYRQKQQQTSAVLAKNRRSRGQKSKKSESGGSGENKNSSGGKSQGKRGSDGGKGKGGVSSKEGKK